MNYTVKTLALTGAVASLAFGIPAAAGAQAFSDPSIPNYTQWQSSWDKAAFRDRHVMVGEVIAFRPYRVRLRRSNGVLQMVDLKRGTSILPTGATPTPGERVALIGYYSQGTFIVNRLVVR